MEQNPSHSDDIEELATMLYVTEGEAVGLVSRVPWLDLDKTGKRAYQDQALLLWERMKLCQ